MAYPKVLLLVVNHSAGELLALGIGSGDGDRAGLAVGRHDATTADRNFVALLDRKSTRLNSSH